MTENPRDYPDVLTSAESGRPMTRGMKERTITVDGKTFTYRQPGWWCSLTDPNDNEGQLVDEDNRIARMARLTAKSLASGEAVFVPVVIRAIRMLLGITQREAGLLFGTGEKSFEKYEAGEIRPSEPTKRLLKLAMIHPEMFAKSEGGPVVVPAPDDGELAREIVRKTDGGEVYDQLFERQAAAIGVEAR